MTTTQYPRSAHNEKQPLDGEPLTLSQLTSLAQLLYSGEAFGGLITDNDVRRALGGDAPRDNGLTDSPECSHPHVRIMPCGILDIQWQCVFCGTTIPREKLNDGQPHQMGNGRMPLFRVDTPYRSYFGDRDNVWSDNAESLVPRCGMHIWDHGDCAEDSIPLLIEIRDLCASRGVNPREISFLCDEHNGADRVLEMASSAINLALPSDGRVRGSREEVIEAIAGRKGTQAVAFYAEGKSGSNGPGSILEAVLTGHFIQKHDGNDLPLAYLVVARRAIERGDFS